MPALYTITQVANVVLIRCCAGRAGSDMEHLEIVIRMGGHVV